MKQDNGVEIAIKNMVCNRCIKVVKDELLKHNIDFDRVDLGSVFLNRNLSEGDKEKLRTILEKEGFELVEDRETVIVKNIKTVIVQVVHHGKEKPKHQTFSEFIASQMGMDYFQLSKLFSEVEGKTIEHYMIEQRIERAKELIVYNELSFSQISYQLNYSSPQHFSKQFKQITGFTPSAFKSIKTRKKLDTI